MSQEENKTNPLIILTGKSGIGKGYIPKENEVLIDVPYKFVESDKKPVITIVRELHLDRHDVDYLHDGIIDLFDDVIDDVTDEQVGKLLTLCPDWDGVADTLGKGQVLNSISRYFVNMKVPTYGDGNEYFDNFYAAIKSKKEDIIKFISTK